MRRPIRLLLFAAALLVTALPACFHPDQPVCAFTCLDPPYQCPPDFTCQADGLCHSDQRQGVCPLEMVDAAAGSDGTADAPDQ